MGTLPVPAPESRTSQGWTGQLGRLGRLMRKELSEILRDRRTVITLVLMPLLLYPLLSIAFRQFFLVSALETGTGLEYWLGFYPDGPAQAVVDHLHLQEQPT